MDHLPRALVPKKWWCAAAEPWLCWECRGDKEDAPSVLLLALLLPLLLLLLYEPLLLLLLLLFVEGLIEDDEVSWGDEELPPPLPSRLNPG